MPASAGFRFRNRCCGQGRKLRIAAGQGAELRSVGTRQKFDADRGVCLRVKLLQPLADVRSRHAYDGVVSRVVRRGPPEKGHAKAALFQLVGLPRQSLLDDVLEKLLAPPASFEGRAL